MANNRLYLYDPETHEAFMLCKSSGEGWSVAPRFELDDVMRRLDTWLTWRDMDASYGNCLNVKTQLRLCTEADLPPGTTLNQETDGSIT